MTDLVPTQDHIELARSVRKMLDKRSDSQAVRNAFNGFDADAVVDAVRADGRRRAGDPGGVRRSRVHPRRDVRRARGARPRADSHSAPRLRHRRRSADRQPAARADRRRHRRNARLVRRHRSRRCARRRHVQRTASSPARCRPSCTAMSPRSSSSPPSTTAVSASSASTRRRSRVRRSPDSTRRSASPTSTSTASLPRRSPSTPRQRLATAHRVGTLAAAALQVGCAQRGLDMTVEYTKQREQFGRPIGSFQALKHRMADLLVLVQMSRAGAWAAVQAHVNDAPNADRLAAAAGSYCQRRRSRGRRRDRPAPRRHRHHLGARRAPRPQARPGPQPALRPPPPTARNAHLLGAEVTRDSLQHSSW